MDGTLTSSSSLATTQLRYISLSPSLSPLLFLIPSIFCYYYFLCRFQRNHSGVDIRTSMVASTILVSTLVKYDHLLLSSPSLLSLPPLLLSSPSLLRLISFLIVLFLNQDFHTYTFQYHPEEITSLYADGKLIFTVAPGPLTVMGTFFSSTPPTLLLLLPSFPPPPCLPTLLSPLSSALSLI